MSNDTREQQRIVDQIKYKLSDKERYERDYKNAQDKLSHNSTDSSAVRDLERASDQLRRIDDEINSLKSQL